MASLYCLGNIFGKHRQREMTWQERKGRKREKRNDKKCNQETEKDRGRELKKEKWWKSL